MTYARLIRQDFVDALLALVENSMEVGMAFQSRRGLAILLLTFTACVAPPAPSTREGEPSRAPSTPTNTIVVVSSPMPTSLPVASPTVTISAPVTSTPAPPLRFNTASILDASGSMLANLGGRPRLAVAQDAVGGLASKLPAGMNTSLWVYGHRVEQANKDASCRDIEQVIKLGPVDAARLNSAAHSFAAKGYTPITESLRQAAASLPIGASERNQVVLVSDGEETCAGDPCALAAQLAASDVKLVIHTIGLAVDNVTRAQLQCIARVSNGTYRDATNAGELSAALEQAARDSAARVLKEMSRPSSVAFSPDGQFVYITASGSEALFVFRRDAGTGKLAFLEMHKNGVAGVKGLDGAHSVAVSPDGRNVYAIGLTDDAIVTFQRNPTTGALTFSAMHKDGVGGVDGLNEANFVTLSPDGKHVYVTSSEDDALVVFTRNVTTGALTFAKMYKHGVGGVDGLNRVMGATVSPDGKFLYTVSDPSSRDDPLVLFRRDANTGLLTFVRAYKDDVDGVDGLQGGHQVIISPDGRHLYATGRIDDAVAVFTRDVETGAVKFVEAHKYRVGGSAIANLDGARGLAISADGQFVYVTADVIDTLIVFKRDSGTGALTFAQMLRDNTDGVDGLENAHVVAISPDGKHAYVAGFDDNAVAIFTRDAGAGSLTFVQAIKEAK